MAQEWNETELWKRIEAFEGDDLGRTSAVTLCNAWMETISTALDDTARLKDFTLHNSRHSFRVAERMMEVVPKGTELTVQELTLLLLSAYLHDIGMVPDQSLIEAVRGHLKGSPTGQHGDEVILLAKWLGDFAPDTTLPITKDTLPEGETCTDDWIEFLTQHFCRRRHCDWAEGWITKHGPSQALYPGWDTHLIALCHSHHWGRSGLDNLDLVQVPGRAPDAKVNLRYLALVLRVADVMDADPERVPEILYESRDVALPSRVFWDKDKTISVKIADEAISGHRVVRLQATPGNAKSHHACLETAKQISTELALAASLVTENWHAHGDTAETARCPWTLPHGVTTEVKALNGAYTYIDGAFRPDTKRVLQILGGLDLYTDTMAAVRELIQNAFDAVRFTIAEDMLERARREGAAFAPEEARLKIGDNYHVELTLAEDAGVWWLICRDNGCGMSKAVIENRLLVSGAGHGHREIDLNEKCKAKGFSPEITGKFGIGVLSYFMLADSVRIRTAPGTADPDVKGNQGWEFTTEGVGSFGQLKRWPSDFHRTGTEVALRLRPKELGANPDAWFARLVQHVNNMLVRVPAHVTLAKGGESPALALKPGWTWDLERYRGWLGKQNYRFHTDPHRPGSNDLYSDDDQLAKKRAIEVAKSVTFLDRVLEGELERGLGRYFIRIPAFVTPHGPLPFLPYAADWGGTTYAKGDNMITSWKGIGVGVTDGKYGSVFGEYNGTLLLIDLTDPKCGILPASRATLAANPELRQALNALQDIVSNLLCQAISLIPAPLHEIYAAWMAFHGQAPRQLPPPQADFLWPDVGDWIKVTCPMITNHYPAPLVWRGQKLSTISAVRQGKYASGISPSKILNPVSIAWFNHTVELIHDHPLTRPAFQWRGYIFSALAFPPEWSAIAVIRGAVNEEGSLAPFLEKEALSWIDANLDENGDPRPHQDEMLHRPVLAGAWLLLALSEKIKIFSALHEKQPEAIRALWKAALGTGAAVPITRGYNTFGVGGTTLLNSFHPDSGWSAVSVAPRPADAKWRIEEAVETMPIRPKA